MELTYKFLYGKKDMCDFIEGCDLGGVPAIETHFTVKIEKRKIDKKYIQELGEKMKEALEIQGQRVLFWEKIDQN